MSRMGNVSEGGRHQASGPSPCRLPVYPVSDDHETDAIAHSPCHFQEERGEERDPEGS